MNTPRRCSLRSHRRGDPHEHPRMMARWACPGCGYVFDETTGDEREGFPAGTAWSDVPDDWCCPDCGVREKVDFEPA